MSYVCCLLAIIVGFYLIMRRKDLGFLLPSRLLGIFGMVTWSPLCILYPAETAVDNVFLEKSEINHFFVCYACIYIFVAIGCILHSLIFPIKKCISDLGDKNEVNRVVRVIIVFTSLTLILLSVLDQSIRQYLITNWQYIFNTSPFSYKEVRREMIYGGLYESVWVRFQYSLVYLLFVTNAWMAIRYKFKLHWLLVILLFCCCAISLKKFTFLWYALSLCYLFYLNMSKTAQKKLVPYLFVLIPPILLGSFYGLYKWQYKDVSVVTDEAIVNTMFSRSFVGYPDGFKLYTILFPDVFPYTYGGTSDFLAAIVGRYPGDPLALVPEYFGLKTTFPAGFAGGGYSAGGFTGLILMSLFVGFLAGFLDHASIRVTKALPEFKVPFMLAVSASTLWLWTKPIPTSLLTGGNLLIILYILFIYWVALFIFNKENSINAKSKVY